MIGKLLLIGPSGLLPFYLNQFNIEIDNDLLSGFCQALYGLSKELTFPLKNIGFEAHKMLVQNFNHEEKEFLVASLYDEFMIEEGIKNKGEYIFNTFFKKYEVLDEGKRITNEALNRDVTDAINDIPLKTLIKNNINIVDEVLEPILREKDNRINAYCLTSSTNNLLYYNGCLDMLQNRPGQDFENIIKEYLFLWGLDKIPHGDQFTGPELPMGLDLVDYPNTGEKTHGIVINTSINLKHEPNNEMLLYFFGKNMLMRSMSSMSNIEEVLRVKFSS